MTYKVKFREDALKEWHKLNKANQKLFAEKLIKCCKNPHIPQSKLKGINDCYKVKQGKHAAVAACLQLSD